MRMVFNKNRYNCLDIERYGEGYMRIEKLKSLGLSLLWRTIQIYSRDKESSKGNQSGHNDNA